MIKYRRIIDDYCNYTENISYIQTKGFPNSRGNWLFYMEIHWILLTLLFLSLTWSEVWNDFVYIERSKLSDLFIDNNKNDLRLCSDFLKKFFKNAYISFSRFLRILIIHFVVIYSLSLLIIWLNRQLQSFIHYGWSSS